MLYAILTFRNFLLFSFLLFFCVIVILLHAANVGIQTERLEFFRISIAKGFAKNTRYVLIALLLQIQILWKYFSNFLFLIFYLVPLKFGRGSKQCFRFRKTDFLQVSPNCTWNFTICNWRISFPGVGNGKNSMLFYVFF